MNFKWNYPGVCRAAVKPGEQEKNMLFFVMDIVVSEIFGEAETDLLFHKLLLAFIKIWGQTWNSGDIDVDDITWKIATVNKRVTVSSLGPVICLSWFLYKYRSKYL